MIDDMAGIREEQSADIAAIRRVNSLAFGRDQEANIVDALRANGAALLSLIAADEDGVMGHIMYSPATINDVVGAALGPMAVAPRRQRQGVGSRLVRAGNEILRRRGCPFVIVIGHPSFYPRFGFQVAKPLGITTEWEVPDEAFMVAALDTSMMKRISGEAKYRVEFSTVL
jgi:putative acetyltransferase